MSFPNQGAMLYTQGFGSRPENVEVPHLDVRDPATTDILYPIGKRWINTVLQTEYSLTGLSTFNGLTTASWSLLGSEEGALNTLTTSDSTVVVPVAGNINLLGAGSVTTIGSGATATVELTGLTTHNLLVGAGTTTITKVAPSATSGIPVISQGASADPAYGTAVVAGGGTGLTTITAHDLVVGNGTSPMTIISNGTTGQALVAASAADPAWGTLPVAGGGTGAVTLTGVVTGNGTSAMTANAVTQHGVVIGGAANAVGSTSVGATGTVLAGSTGADPAFSATPALTSVAIGAGGLTITSGTGAPSASVPQGSLYLRTDGSGANDRAYIATDNAGTWTPIVTVG